MNEGVLTGKLVVIMERRKVDFLQVQAVLSWSGWKEEQNRSVPEGAVCQVEGEDSVRSGDESQAGSGR